MVCISCLVFRFVFFFKQKTAYEMRISDWSSDVCSSDLVHVLKIALRDLLRRDIDQPGLRVVAHRVPIMRAERAGDGDEGFAGPVEARLGIFDRPSGRPIISARPVDPVDEGLGVVQLAGRAGDGEDEAGIWRGVLTLDRIYVPRLPG